MPSRAGRWASARLAEPALAATVLGLAAVLRFWELAERPGFDWDEPIYNDIGASVAAGHGIELKPSATVEQVPYLFHPPFYFLLLGQWYRLAGPGIPSARVLAAAMSIATLVLLYLFMRRRWGAFALVPLAFLATDGWLVFSNRVGWIENTMLLVAVAAIIAYDRAVRRESIPWFLVAGELMGLTAIFKHVGFFVLLAVAIHWAVVRRQHSGHLLTLAVAVGVVAIYVAAMTANYGHPGGNHFLEESTHQLQRVVGAKERRGSVEDPGQVVAAVIGPYKVFVTTMALAAVGAALMVAGAIRAWRRRSLRAASADPLLWSWALGAVVFFGAMGIKMPHYYMLVQIPLYLFIAAETLAGIERRRGRARKGHAVERRAPAGRVGGSRGRPRHLRGRARIPAKAVIASVVGALLALNAMTFKERFVDRHDNALKDVASFADQSLPRDTTVLTEETVGTIIRQPYCKFFRAGPCRRRTEYIMVYRSRTHAPPDEPALHAMLSRARPVRSFSGFKEAITVYRTGRRRGERRGARSGRRQVAGSGARQARLKVRSG